MQVNIETLKAMKNSGRNLIIIQLIASIVLFLLPNLLPNSIFKIIGFVAIAIGAFLIYTTIKKPKELTSWKSYILPVVMVLVGLFVFIQTQEALQLVALAIGLATIVKGIGTVFLKDTPVQNPRYKIFGIISICIGISVIIFSNNIGAFLSYYIGAILLYHAIVDILLYIDLGKVINSAGNSETITITK